MSINVVEVEVLSSETQKYASTKVSGGGTNYSTGPSVPTQVQPVTSTTTFHSDQSIWFKSIENGREIQLELTSYNFSMRAGHRLMVVTHDDSPSEIERMHNINTGETTNCKGTFNLSRLRGSGIQHTTVLFYGLLMLVPLLNFLIIPAAVASFVFLYDKDGFIALARRRDRLLTAGTALLAIPASLALTSFDSGLFKVVVPALLMAPFYLSLLKLQRRSNSVIEKQSTALDAALETALRSR